jgi:hypothetical protein
MDDVSISPISAVLESPILQYAIWTAAAVSAITGVLVRRWWHGLITTIAILAAFVGFVFGYPVIAFGAPFYVPPIDGVWREVTGMGAFLVAIFSAVFALRWLVIRSWRRVAKSA